MAPVLASMAAEVRVRVRVRRRVLVLVLVLASPPVVVTVLGKVCRSKDGWAVTTPSASLSLGCEYRYYQSFGTLYN